MLKRAGQAAFAAPAEEPLTLQRVRRASHATAALFGWCTAAVVEVAASHLGVAQEASEEPKPPSLDIVHVDVPAPPLPPTPRAPTPEASPPDSLEPPPADTLKPDPKRHQQVHATVVKPIVADKPVLARPTDKPDRHFEAIAEFELGYLQLTSDGELILQTVAATICMRKQLTLELQGSAHPLESEAMVSQRLRIVEAFFEQQGLSTSPTALEPRKVGEGIPGVICRLSLSRDRELRDFFLFREAGEELKISRATRCVVQSLEEDFTTCKTNEA